MSGPNLRALEALLIRCRQDEEAAEGQLVDAVKSLERAEAVRADAESKVVQSLDALNRAIAETRVTTGAVQRMNEARAFASRRRDEHATSEVRLRECEALRDRASDALSDVRRVLAELRGKREAVEGRITAERKALARKAEERVDDEAADRSAAAIVGSRPKR